MTAISERSRTGWLAGLVATAALASGCIDPFSGSKIEILFAGSVPLPGAATPGAPPSGTHLQLYAVRDDVSVPVLSLALDPVVRTSDPCFIEQGRSIPLTNVSADGLHVTQWYDKSLEIYEADGVITDDEAGALADASRRVDRNLALLEQGIIAVTATPYGRHDGHDFSPAEVEARLAAVPAAGDSDDASNRLRAQLCAELFALVPEYYVGSDRLVTLPTNGVFYGVTDGQDPRSGGFIGGATLDLAARLDAFDALRLNWQFDDPADPRAEALGDSPTGYHFMAGVPERRTRGVINVHLENNDFPSISADLGLYTNLDDDGTGF